MSACWTWTCGLIQACQKWPEGPTLFVQPPSPWARQPSSDGTIGDSRYNGRNGDRSCFCGCFPSAQTVKNLPAMLEPRFDPWIRKILWRKEWQPTPEFHGQRGLEGYSTCGLRRVRHDWATNIFTFFLSCFCTKRSNHLHCSGDFEESSRLWWSHLGEDRPEAVKGIQTLGKNFSSTTHLHLSAQSLYPTFTQWALLSCSTMSDSSWPHGLQPTRLLCPWGFPGKKYWSR